MPSSRPVKKTTTRGTKAPLRNVSTDKRLASSKITTGYSASKNGVTVTASGLTRDGNPGSKNRTRTGKTKIEGVKKGAFGLAFWNDPTNKKTKGLKQASRQVQAMEKNYYKKKQR